MSDGTVGEGGAAAPATMRDVARRAGVSVSLVSRVLRGQESYAAPETRDAIRRAARELAYEPNEVARRLRAGQNPVVGVLFHRLVAYRAFAPVLSGVEDVLRRAGYGLLVRSTDGAEDEAAGLQLYRAQRVAGVVVVSNYWRVPAGHLAEAVGRGTPLVAVNRWLEGDGDGQRPAPGPVPRVLWDNAGGARALTAALVALGHRRLGFLNDAPYARMAERVNYLQRWHAVRGAALEAGLPEPARYLVADVAAGAWRREGVTALLGVTDDPAADAVHAVDRQGYRVPEAVTVTGFADSDVARRITPRLTTVRLPYEESGRAAAETVLRLIRGEAVERLAVLPCPVVTRESSAPPAAPGGP